ncbi:MAG TPA: PDP protein [Campylobacterales bacterium]|nr:PDP protein [Campylobacterales bacterium]
MKRTFFLITIIISVLFAENATVDCNKIFELRKQEIVKELERIDEQAQSLEALKNANEELLLKKETQLLKKEEEVKAELLKVQTTKDEVLALYEKNKKVLANIKDAKDDKLSQTYLKMKEGKAAAILDNMKQSEAALILFNLTPKKISKIMAKMDPNNASKITKLLSDGPPFDNNISE